MLTTNYHHNSKMLTFYACCVWIALKSGRTHAQGPVVVDAANGRGCALLRHARIPALLPDACKGDGAFGVHGAFGFRC